VSAPCVIPVACSSGSYSVVVGSGLLPRLASFAAHALGSLPRRVLLVADDGLPEVTVDSARDALTEAGCACAIARVRADERHKSLAAAEQLLLAACGHHLDRADLIVALGGGLTGDLAGFAGSMYRRGVNVIQCPTTLLAMVDASVGGKTGVNLDTPQGLLKNMAGAFHQPRLVLADVGTLFSLPARQFRSGLGECLKHGLLAADFGDPGLWGATVGLVNRVIAHNPEALVELVARNVRVKGMVVGDDERELKENAGRALLNLGHTFGHAIETIDGVLPDWALSRHGPAEATTSTGLLHGEAVAIGLHAAAVCSVASGLAPQSLITSVLQGIVLSGLPGRAHHLPGEDEILARMRQDKKVIGGVPRLVLPVSGGRCVVRSDVPEGAIRAALRAIRAEET
jgi:shikimate kinase/3-dehydroquinate synthase